MRATIRKKEIPGGEAVAVLYLDEDEIVQGSAASPVDFDRALRTLPTATFEKLGEAVEARAGQGQSTQAFRLLVRSFIQNIWYEAIKGEIPMAVKKAHEAREDQIGKAAAASSQPAASADGKPAKEPRTAKPRADPRTTIRWAIVDGLADDKKASLGKIRGQAKVVIDQLIVAAGTPKTAKELADMALAEGTYPSKHDDVSGSFVYHLKGLRANGYVTGVDVDAAPEAAPQAAAVAQEQAQPQA